MRDFIARNLQRAAEWYVGAQQRAQRRRSPWNLILLPLGLVAVAVTWYGLFRVAWAFHLLFYPQHELRDFWGSGISFSSFVPSFLMVFAVAPGALCTGLAAANCVAWLVRPARRTFDAESVGHPGTGFWESTRLLFLCAAWAVPLGLVIALVAACFLRSLR
jgi:ABC-type sugar transport system permease subunit